MLFTNILFPVDFSGRSRAIVPHVRALCDRFKASLTLLHVVQVPVMAYGAVDSPVVYDFPLAEVMDAAEKSLAEFGADQFPGMRLKTVVEEGDPGSCIAERAREWNTDLIMMPTRGRGLFRATLLGSVTTKTLHDAVCAVWTDAHCENAAERDTDWRNIICAIDTDQEGASLIRYAAALEACSNATVHLAHAVPAPEASDAARYIGQEFTEKLKAEARKAIASMQEEAGTNFGVCVEAYGIPQVVRHAAESHHADLVLIGRGVIPEFAGRLRSHAYAIVRSMPCSVLSV